MALILSPAALLEKNKLSNDGAWIVALRITMLTGDVLRVCRNNEDIVIGDETFQAFPFELGETGEDSAGAVPSVKVQVCNIDRIVQRYVEGASGGVGATVEVLVFHTKHIDEGSVLPPMSFQVTSTSCTPEWVTFMLGAENPYQRRFPMNKTNAHYCRNVFKDKWCQYRGPETDCNRTLTRCRELGNSECYGGFPGTTTRGIYV